VAPRNSAALIVAATLAFVGAAITIGALFPDYWDAPSFSLIDDTASLAQTAVFAGALVLAGVLLLARRSAPIGSGMLVVVVAFGLQPRVDDIVTLADTNGPRAGTGFSLITAGFVLGLFAAVLSSFVALRPRSWSMLGGARPLAVLASLFGFAAAVGYTMNPFTIGIGGDLSFDLSGGSPLDTSDPNSARFLWAAVLVVVLLAVLPPLAVAVGGRIGTGLALGLLFGIGGIAALRLGAIYGSSEIAGRGSSVSLEGAEGTWTFVAAGGAVLIVTWFGLAAGGVRRPRAASMTPVTSAPPPGEHVVTGDDPSAIVEPNDRGAGTLRRSEAGPERPGAEGAESGGMAAGDTSGDDSDTTAVDTGETATTTRIEPMPAADSTTTWNAADPAPERPAE
jgi:hypothetical protein